MEANAVCHKSNVKQLSFSNQLNACSIYINLYYVLLRHVLIYILEASFHVNLDCKTVRILVYSSKPEQSNERSGTRLKTESETEKYGLSVLHTSFSFELPASPATGNSHWLNFNASFQQAVK